MIQIGESIDRGKLNVSPKVITNNAIKTLIMGLNSDKEGVISQCVFLATEHRIVEAIEPLEKIMNSNLTFEIKASAVYALYQIQTSDALEVLKNAYIGNS